MIKDLDFSVTFRSTQRTFKGKHTFGKGLTAITGANESGKTLRTEMIRYALWGTPALRSPIKSYISLTVRLTFSLKGDEYKIERSKSSCMLYRNGEVLCTGTKPSNQMIRELFGYDMEVFDSANAILQKKAEALTDKTPAERKRMIDKTIGLSSLEELIKEVSLELSAKRSEKKGYESCIESEPIAPLKPREGSEENVKLKLSDLRKEIEELNNAQVLLEAKKTTPIEKPDSDPLWREEETLKLEQELKEKEERLFDYRRRKSVYDSERKRALELEKKIEQSPLKDFTVEYLEEYLKNDWPEKIRARREWEQERAQLPTVPVEHNLLLEKKLHEIREIRNTLEQVKADNRIHCTSCGAENFINREKVEEIEAKIPQDFEYREPRLSLGEIRKYETDLEKIVRFEEKKVPEEVPENVSALHRKEVEDYLHYQDMLREMDFEEPEKPDFSEEDLKELRARINENERLKSWWQRYNDSLERYQEYLELKNKWEEKLQALPELKSLEREYEELKNLWISYRSLYANYLNLKELRDGRIAALAELDDHIQELSKVKQALEDIKPKVKTYLIPSLERVSSNFLSQMTGGKRNTIKIEEDFSIFADGQEVSELSGSAEAATNLALRLALGTILTNRVFSVLIADEVDSSMDKERAENTASCLRELSDTISQIILVSHQAPEADHTIEL